MLSKSAIIIGLASAFLCTAVFAQSTLSVQNKYVMAKVQQGTGLLWVVLPPGLASDPKLSFQEKSFLTVNVNGRIFTNNRTGMYLQNHPSFAGYLVNGINQKIRDTIRTTWYNIDNCDIIQEVYPVLLDTSGQIVMRWKVRNNDKAVPIYAQCQFLLDLQVGAKANDGSPVLTRYGYHPIWEQYTPTTDPHGMPWFFAAFENRPSGNPGVIGIGYTEDRHYKLGLIRPAAMTIGDWGYTVGGLVDYLWGPPPDARWGEDYRDAAILYNWDGYGILPNKTAEIGRTSYGTPEFALCYGELFGILFYPRHFRWSATKYEPDTGAVEFYAFNTHSPTPGTTDFGQAALNTQVKLHVGPSLRIVDPPADANSNGKIGTLLTSPDAGYIPQRNVGTAFWKIVADKARNCYNEIDSWLKFTIESSLGASNGDTCEHPVKVDCVEEDRDPPMVDNESKSTNYPYIDTFSVHDDRATDKGIDKVQWIPTPGSNTDKAKFTIVMRPDYMPCYRKPYTVVITQLDSTIGGCFDFTFLDCAGNDTTYTVCLPAHPVPIIPDTLPPLVVTIEHVDGYPGAGPCNGRCDSLLITDTRKNDKGLKIIETLAINNMVLRTDPVTEGEAVHRAKVCVIDTMLDGDITLQIRDVADNYTDTTFRYCTIADTLAPLVTIMEDQLNRGHWTIVVEEVRDWDRRIDRIEVSNLINAAISSTPSYSAWDQTVYPVVVSIIDSTKSGSFCVRALDKAGNWSTTKCPALNPDPDTLCPNFVTPVITPFMPSISISINDYHVNGNGDTVGWDKGIDSVWFSSVRGIIVPGPMSIDCKMAIPAFTMSVEDTLNVDSVACATVNVLDCAGNSCNFTWCYPYNPDDLPPLMRARYTTKTNIDFFVFDSGRYDRGVQKIELKEEDNFSPFIANAERTVSWGPGSLSRQYSRSSVGTLEAIDYWGTLTYIPTVKALHTASVDLSVWVQDVQMKKGIIIEDEDMFEVPLNFLTNDTFSLERKGIDAFEFTLKMAGNSEAMQFAGVRTVGTATDGWNVVPTVNNNLITIKATKPPGSKPLTGNLSIPLLALQFNASRGEATKEVLLTAEPTKGESILYNNGEDRIVIGKNAIATLPAPYGTLSGTQIVIPGICEPLVLTGSLLPSIVSLEQNSPNPFSSRTTFNFTVKEDGLVRLVVYDLLGKEVQLLVNDILARGRYTATFDGTKHGSGAYIARLVANGTVRSRMIHIEH
jgi:hypothetical protein